MKITKTQLKQIIKEELDTMPGALTETDQSDIRLRRLRKQRQTVSDLAAIASLGDIPAADGPEPPQVDIVNALDMANRMEDSGDMADLRYVIQALEQALNKLGGQEEEPRDPYDAGY